MQSGVSERFAIRVPVDLTLSAGSVVRRHILTEGARTEVELTVTGTVNRVTLAPEDSLLAIKR